MTAPIRARLGAAIEDQLAHAGANTSVALRAYVLLGTAATGQDMAPFAREIHRALGAELAPAILAALESLKECRTPDLPMSYVLRPPAPVGATVGAGGRAMVDVADEQADALDDDPFANVGIEV